MTTSTFAAAKLPSAQRIELAIQALAGAAKVSHLASQNNVSSRKFVYQQKDKAELALDAAFAPSREDEDALFIFLSPKRGYARLF
jgi:hypothetical protein